MTTLYISDLDGTLLQPDASLSDYGRLTLNALLNQGLLFTVASARSIVTMQTILADLKLRLPVIEFNGGFISDLHSGEHLIIHDIDTGIAKAVYQAICDAGLIPFVSTFDGSADRLHFSTVQNEGMVWYLRRRQAAKDRRLRYTNNLRQVLTEQVVCFTVIGQKGLLAELEAIVQEQFGTQIDTHCYENQYSPGWYWFTIHDRRANKEFAIQRLIKLADLQPQELITFGDQINDLRMLQHADRGIAVANAIPQLKENAAHVIGPNTNDSVVQYIAQDVASKNGRSPHE